MLIGLPRFHFCHSVSTFKLGEEGQGAGRTRGHAATLFVRVTGWITLGPQNTLADAVVVRQKNMGDGPHRRHPV